MQDPHRLFIFLRVAGHLRSTLAQRVDDLVRFGWYAQFSRQKTGVSLLKAPGNAALRGARPAFRVRSCECRRPNSWCSSYKPTSGLDN